ncbi:hypothetical protein QQP08_004859 [Theobroma cacao]|nr:hypothetical protein QQP08_004859 [Theobroma cacao]
MTYQGQQKFFMEWFTKGFSAYVSAAAMLVALLPRDSTDQSFCNDNYRFVMSSAENAMQA